MPIRKFRRIEDTPAPAWRVAGDPALERAVAVRPEHGCADDASAIPPGVYEHRSIDEMHALQDDWRRANRRLMPGSGGGSHGRAASGASPDAERTRRKMSPGVNPPQEVT